MFSLFAEGRSPLWLKAIGAPKPGILWRKFSFGDVLENQQVAGSEAELLRFTATIRNRQLMRFATRLGETIQEFGGQSRQS
jgi:hypothetical protein